MKKRERKIGEKNKAKQIADSNDAQDLFTGLSSSNCKLIPEALVVDRGPALVSKSVQSVSKSLDAQIETAPPYRPDWKALIERHFKTINITLIGGESNADASPSDS